MIGADSPAHLVRQVIEQCGDQPAALSAVGYAEVAHGIYRAQSDAQRRSRSAFVEGLVAELGVYAFTREAAGLAARIGAEGYASGNVIPIADLFIGATALSLGFAVLTANNRHFRLIPGLSVISFKPRT